MNTIKKFVPILLVLGLVISAGTFVYRSGGIGNVLAYIGLGGILLTEDTTLSDGATDQPLETQAEQPVSEPESKLEQQPSYEPPADTSGIEQQTQESGGGFLDGLWANIQAGLDAYGLGGGENGTNSQPSYQEQAPSYNPPNTSSDQPTSTQPADSGFGSSGSTGRTVTIGPGVPNYYRAGVKLGCSNPVDVATNSRPRDINLVQPGQQFRCP